MSGERDPDPSSRRGVIGLLGGTLAALWTGAVAVVAGAFVTSPLRAPAADAERALAEVSALTNTFTAVRVRFPVEDGWHRRVDTRIVYARLREDRAPEVLSATCTHLGCTVNWDVAQNAFLCPCHGARFGPDGAVIEGPPPGPLAQIPAMVRGGTVFIRLA